MVFDRFRRKKPVEEKTAVEEKREPSALEKKCIEHGRPDLYEPLSWTIRLEPRGRDLEALLAQKTALNYSIASSVMLYRTRGKEGEERLKLLEKAKEYFLAAHELSKEMKWSSYLPIVTDNINIVADIVVDWLLSEGKYEELKKGK